MSRSSPWVITHPSLMFWTPCNRSLKLLIVNNRTLNMQGDVGVVGMTSGCNTNVHITKEFPASRCRAGVWTRRRRESDAMGQTGAREYSTLDDGGYEKETPPAEHHHLPNSSVRPEASRGSPRHRRGGGKHQAMSTAQIRSRPSFERGGGARGGKRGI